MPNGWRVSADVNIRTPESPYLRDEFPAKGLVELAQKRIVERPAIELAGFDTIFEKLDLAREMRRKLGIAQDTECRFNAAGGVWRACSCSNFAKSTASPSKAMLSATFRGMRFQRRRAFSSIGSVRQELMACFQFMVDIIGRMRLGFNHCLISRTPPALTEQGLQARFQISPDLPDKSPH